jgi:hypothetical protein
MMTDKAARILQKMKRRDRKKASKLFRSPKARGRVLDEFNRSTLDDVSPVGGDQEIKVLKELNEMQDLRNA